MTNKFTSPPPDELIRAKLEVLLETANRVYQEGGAGLKEDIIDAYNEALGLFFDSFDNSIVGVTFPIMPGMPADPVDYNVFSRAVLYDLKVLFSQAGAIDRMISTNFNSIVSLKDRLLAQTRRIASKTADYLLYADEKLGGIGYFFGDSFNSARYLDLESKLVEDELCFLNQEEGVITLPLDGKPERIKIAKYIVNASSNGELGNNHQEGVEPHNDLQALGDGQPDTWVEYERVTAGHSSTPLVLDITLVLQQPKIINHIHLLPVQFGTPTPVSIAKLETSSDGKEFSSIKDEVPIVDFLSEVEEDTFELSGKTSKYSGEGYYSFLPRRVQYVHLVLEQRTPYMIETLTGSRLRYAIGLKDINIYTRKFKPNGSIVSKKIAIDGDATKIAMWASENPKEASKLADIRHDISFDDGASWTPIQPKGREKVVYREVINLNNAEEGSISTQGEVSSIRHKITLSRTTSAFAGEVTLKQEKQSAIELVPVTGVSPPVISLQNEPISETVHVSIPIYGSWSCPRERNGLLSDLSPPMDLDFIEATISSATTETIRFKLPYKNIPNLPHRIRVFVDGAQWYYCSTSPVELADITPNSRVYFLNQSGREIQFVYIDDLGNKYGKLPGSGAKVQICLDGDNPPLTKTDAGYTLQLAGSADGFKKYVCVVTPTTLEANTDDDDSVVGSWGTAEEFVVPLGQQYVNLSKYIVEHSAEENSWGTLPPIFNTDEDSFEMVEAYEYLSRKHFYKTNPELSDTDPDDVRADGQVPFIDGEKEFYCESEGVVRTNRWSFDPYVGIIYFARPLMGTHRVTFKYHRRNFKVLEMSEWDFYRNKATNKTDMSKIVLKPSCVYQFPVNKTIAEGTTSISLVQQMLPRHDWWTQKIVRGSVFITPASRIFSSSEDNIAPPVEVRFIDGYSELQNTTAVSEVIAAQDGNGLHSFSLGVIDSTHILVSELVFEPLVEYPDPIQSSQFVTKVSAVGDVDTAIGNWFVDIDTGLVTVNVGPSVVRLNTHTVKYSFEDTQNGVNKAGLYSVDYDNGSIYFASPVAQDTSILFNVTMYSAFYNMSEVVEGENIKSIEEKAKKIELDVNYAEKFLKDPSPQNPRPKFIKVGYDFYKRSNESLKDLEPYFSPICKELALNVITKDFLGTL